MNSRCTDARQFGEALGGRRRGGDECVSAPCYRKRAATMELEPPRLGGLIENVPRKDQRYARHPANRGGENPRVLSVGVHHVEARAKKEPQIRDTGPWFRQPPRTQVVPEHVRLSQLACELLFVDT